MRAFINFFLLAYALDAAISTIDDLVFVLAGAHVLGFIRSPLALMVLFLCVVVYLSIGIDSRLPKRVLLPPILLAVWAGFGCVPLPVFFDIRSVMLGTSLVQLGLGVFAFILVKRITGGSWFLTQEFFKRPVFQFKNTALFTVANIIAVPVAVCLLLVLSVHLYLHNNTAGFMQAGTDGIYLQERTYSRDVKTIHLVAMMHIGNKEYYDELSHFLSSGSTIVLAEGVTDDTGIIKNFPSYSKFADFIGLDTQENMVMHGKMLEYDDLSTPDDDPASMIETGIVRADIDSQDLSEDALEFVQNVGELFNDEQSFAESFGSYMSWYSDNMTPEKEKIVMGELIDKRNEVLLHYLDEALLYHDTIVIPWGAMHMPGLERAILQKDFLPGESRSRLAVGFDRLIRSNREDGRME
jgi:hypothetical protein